MLAVYDLLGRPVITRMDGVLPAGHGTVTWDGCIDEQEEEHAVRRMQRRLERLEYEVTLTKQAA